MCAVHWIGILNWEEATDGYQQGDRWKGKCNTFGTKLSIRSKWQTNGWEI